jgi:hypothetical protein
MSSHTSDKKKIEDLQGHIHQREEERAIVLQEKE